MFKKSAIRFLQSRMACVSIENGNYVFRTTTLPLLNEGEILLKVRHAGINGPDLYQRKGLYSAPKDHSTIPGLECVGTIVDANGVTDIPSITGKSTNTIAALCPGGAFAEYVKVPANHAMFVPDEMADIYSGFCEPAFTTTLNLHSNFAKFNSRSTLLVHGLGSVGLFAALNFKELGFDSRFATVGSEAKLDELKSSDIPVILRSEYFDLLKNRIDVVLNLLAGETLSRDIDTLVSKGSIVLLGALQGNSSAIPVGKLLMKNGSILTSTLRTQSGEIKHKLRDTIVKSDMKPINIARRFSVDNINNAAEEMGLHKHIGKIIIDF